MNRNSKQSQALLTDLYQITMAYGFWKQGIADREAVFHHSFRRAPFQSGYTIAAGLEGVIDYIQGFSFDSSDLAYLASLKGSDDQPLFEREFLDYLAGLRLGCTVHAIPEGTPVFPHEPLVQVQGPLLQCQLLETPLLNLINFPTLIATKAARVCFAAGGDRVLEFGLRRAQGPDGALTASRAAFIGGVDATSNVLAGKLFGIPVRGTHAHSWVMVFDEEAESFSAYADALPANCIFLVDTYDTEEGVRHAIGVGKRLREEGHEMLGIRLDSGDLAALSRKARTLLDEAGFPDAVIVASNELDEHLIADLKAQGAAITVWGVGTNLVTARDHPALDGVYKLSAIRDSQGHWQRRLKLSEQMVKISNPGVLAVRRFSHAGHYVGDAIYDTLLGIGTPCTIVDPLDPTREVVMEPHYDAVDLLVPIFERGQLVYDRPTLTAIQEHGKRELARFDNGCKRFKNPQLYSVGLERTLYDKKIELIHECRAKMHKRSR